MVGEDVVVPPFLISGVLEALQCQILLKNVPLDSSFT